MTEGLKVIFSADSLLEEKKGVEAVGGDNSIRPLNPSGTAEMDRPTKGVAKVGAEDIAIEATTSNSGEAGSALGLGIIVYQKPAYPILSRIKGEEGRVSLSAGIKEDGLVETVRIEESSGYDRLDRAAVKALYKFRFAPFLLAANGELKEKRVSFVFALQE